MLREPAACLFLHRNAESAEDAAMHVYVYVVWGCRVCARVSSQVGQSKKRYVGSEFPFSRDWLRLHSPPQLAAAQTMISTIRRKKINPEVHAWTILLSRLTLHWPPTDTFSQKESFAFKQSLMMTMQIIYVEDLTSHALFFNRQTLWSIQSQFFISENVKGGLHLPHSSSFLASYVFVIKFFPIKILSKEILSKVKNLI